MPEVMDLKEGNTSPSLKYVIELDAGQTLAGSAARFVMGPEDGGVNFDRVCVVDEAQTALIYDWQVGDTDTPGLFRAEFLVTYSDGTTETWPNGSQQYLFVRITPKVQ